ncbi:MAG: alpha/beta hydrolase [Usitatibacter sp.]
MISADFPNRAGLRLAADYYPAAAGAPAIVMANDIRTHRRWRDRYPFIAEKMSARGIAALAFDYAGCGASADAVMHPVTMMEDLHCAVDRARALGHERVALWGHGLASSLCIEAQVPDVRAMVLSACGTDAIDYDWATELGPENYAKLWSEGTVSVPSYDPAMRAMQTIDRSLLENLSTVSQEALLAKLACPVLLVNGDDNPKERERLEANRRGVELLPPGSGLHVIEGVGHSFAGRFDELADCAIAWLEATW